MTDGYRHIAERPVDPIGAPAQAGSTYYNTSINYDIAISGIPFFLGINREHPYKRETAQYRKQQIDQQKEPGEQTLTGWWLRSQSSFHYGAGIRYEEPIQGETVTYRFNKSAGVDVFNIGKVTLLPDVKKNTDVTVGLNTPIIVGGTDANGIDVYLTAIGSVLYRTTAAGVTTTLTWGGTGAILALAQDGQNYYAANATGIYKGPLTGASSGASIFTHPSSVGTVANVKLTWAKQRLIAGINNYLFEVQPITSFNVSFKALDGLYNATLQTATPHNFRVGDQITVSISDASFDGTYVVTAIPNSTSLTYFDKNGAVQQASTSGTVVLATNNALPIYAHPNSSWKWTGICEGPNAIYVSGYAGDSSTVYRLSLDTAGQVPLLTRALTAADMPKGETIYALGAYIGKYMVFCTNKGIRIGTIDTSGFVSSGYITYGPLSVILNGFDPSSGTNLNLGPSYAVTFADRFAYCTVTNYIDNGDGTFSSGLVKIDLSREIVPNQMAYATHLRIPSTATVSSVAVIGTTGRLVMGANGNGVYEQSTTSLVSSGYIQTGQIRYFTLEDKHFELVKLRETQPIAGTIKLSVVNALGALTDIITADNNFDFTQDIQTGLAGTNPQESIALRFTFTSAVGQDINSPDSFNGYQLKALPAVKRQRIITLPLLNFDFEGDKYNMAVGYEGRAAERTQTLESIESAGDVVTLQDFTNNETVRGVIESVSFIRMTPPERRFTGNGGILEVQFRTI